MSKVRFTKDWSFVSPQVTIDYLAGDEEGRAEVVKAALAADVAEEIGAKSAASTAGTDGKR